MNTHHRRIAAGLTLSLAVTVTGCTDDAQTASALLEPTRRGLSSATGAEAAEARATGGQLVGPGGQCLNVSGRNLTPGGSVIIWPCHGYGTSNELWTVQPAVNGAEVRVFQKDLCLDERTGTGAAGAAVFINACNGKASQQWTVAADGQLRNSAGTCLGTAAGSANRGSGAVLAPCAAGGSAGSAAPAWRVVPWATVPVPVLFASLSDPRMDSVYTGAQPAVGQLIAGATRHCLNVSGWNFTPGGSVITWSCHGGGTGNEMWIVPAAGTAGQVRLKDEDLCLDDRAGTSRVGASVYINRCKAESPSQRWTVTAAGQLRTAGGTCLATPTGATPRGAPAVLAACVDGEAQRWGVRVFAQGTGVVGSVSQTAGNGARQTPQPAPPAAPVPTAPVTAPVTAPITASVTVPVSVTRFDGGSGAVLVSNAIPLKPGMLRPDAIRNVHMLVAGAEQPVYVEALRERHPDGSLRSVLVQWRFSMPANASVPATFVVGSPRSPTADLARPADPRGLPAAAALPTSADYLVETDIVGPTMTEAASAAIPNVATWDANFRRFADWQWDQGQDHWGNNFYDRAHTYYAMWVRTANPVYWRRGTRMAYAYRTGYIEANNSSSLHWAQALGLERHYQLTGDDASRAAISVILNSNGWWPTRLGPAQSEIENRIRARVIQSTLALWRLSDSATEAQQYATQLDAMLNQVLSAQAPDGAYRIWAACGQTMNYMDGMLNDVLIDLHDNYRKDARIPVAIRKSADYLWTQYRETNGGIQYMSGECPNVGGTEPVPVLNSLIVNTFAWTFSRGGGEVYRQRADVMFAGAVRGASLFNGKEFNQQYNTSFHYLAYRR